MSEFGKRARSATWDQLRAAAPHRLTDEDIDLIWLALPDPPCLLPDDDTAVERAVERLAAVEHEQWEKWSREIAEQGLTPERIERWHRYWVPYDQLDEATKEHDRVWARKAIAALREGGQR